MDGKHKVVALRQPQPPAFLDSAQHKIMHLPAMSGFVLCNKYFLTLLYFSRESQVFQDKRWALLCSLTEFLCQLCLHRHVVSLITPLYLHYSDPHCFISLNSKYMLMFLNSVCFLLDCKGHSLSWCPRLCIPSHLLQFQGNLRYISSDFNDPNPF